MSTLQLKQMGQGFTMEQTEITNIKRRLSLVSAINTVVQLAEEEIKNLTGVRMRLMVMGLAPEANKDVHDMATVIANAIGMQPGDLYNMTRKKDWVHLRFLVMLFTNEYFPNMSLKENRETVRV
jgi:hypothetical protein